MAKPCCTARRWPPAWRSPSVSRRPRGFARPRTPAAPLPAIAAAGLPTTLAEVAGHAFDAARLVRHMAQDKKAEAGRLTFILARGLGDAFVAKDAAAAAVAAFLKLEGAA